ncbi:MAG: pyridoxamine 5'-phosphate oxidase family protein [Atopobiaceae bacterium]|jgi:nitroimidazol reductase NimA-like FMN-containing flavoprotein (pyridoxamine 5'-phosphate oxidase superfamily)|nr:pyridoxamine 5'-phosphate oxidase family protein [Atopobiaceae bacterium]MCH4119540.1 pyridoxamine 5'-phosphate oxidase family protein [Atopobiaceae bacterium]MCI1317900.1 pyridoxamine 5'-phosphate oxidase family protein [Atopobiaceae bacterium]MCI1389575.1 pyridoxamine 5'-phosphate oxidase family protein [Atopobiaceae bacterium]MCI1431639.1 pyridoxamine 5'-phosphate oxidase family protein [Atopobiaceae bacterium]
MTDHTKLVMHREHCRISDKDMASKILDMGCVCSVAYHDEPYPYVIQMNYGYAWEGDDLVFYLHLGTEGHKFDLIAANPHVAVEAGYFINRIGHKSYRKELHDYRSVIGYGTAEIINGADEERWLTGMNALLDNCGWPRLRGVSEKNLKRLQVLKVTCPIWTAKSQYPVASLEEVPMPSNEDVDAGNVSDPFPQKKA